MNNELAPVMNTYARFPVTFVSGRGCELFDGEGKRYLDCLSGIAVVPVGHANERVAEAVSRQMRRLVHVSNLFWTEPMAVLAERLCRLAGGARRVFFCNSGAEANECAIKLARKWAGPGRFKIICAEGSFHGRTLATLAATGQPPKWVGFEPLPQGFVHAPFNDLAAFAGAVDGETAGIMVEAVQGEHGVIPAAAGFLTGLRELCRSKNLALIFDEVQTGLCRTGDWWAFQSYGVEPDIFTIAKGLANGLPMGACLAGEDFAAAFKPGDHASTFGGGAVVAQAACATLKFMEVEGCRQMALDRGDQFRKALAAAAHVKEIRGMGLMLGVVLDAPLAKAAVKAALREGLVINATSDWVIRLLPPLIITPAEVEEAANKLAGVLACLPME